MKSADEILSRRQIDAGFSADRRVDLREQCGRNLDDGDTAQVNGRGKSSEIADHAATERQHEIVSFEAIFVEEFDCFFKDRERLVTLAFGHQPMKWLVPGALETAHHFTAVKPENSLV